MICRHKLYHFMVTNTRFNFSLRWRVTVKLNVTIKWYNLCLQIIQSQTCYPLNLLWHLNAQLCLKETVNVIKLIASGRRGLSIANELGVDKMQIMEIMKRKREIIDHFQNNCLLTRGVTIYCITRRIYIVSQYEIRIAIWNSYRNIS